MDRSGCAAEKGKDMSWDAPEGYIFPPRNELDEAINIYLGSDDGSELWFSEYTRLLENPWPSADVPDFCIK